MKSPIGAVVRYRGARVAGYRGRGTRAGRVDHACAGRSVEARPSIRLVVTAALSRKECERAAGVVIAAIAEAETSPLAIATSGTLPIIRYVCVLLSYSNPH